MGLINTLGLNIYKFPSFSVQRTLTIGTPFVIANEVDGALDFNGFPILVDNNGEYIISYAVNTGHGAPSGEGTGRYVKTSSDRGVTWSAKRFIYSRDETGVSASGYGIGFNGRHFIFGYMGTNHRVPYVIYSDDFWETMSDPIKMSDDYDTPNQQLDCTGRSFIYNGEIYIAPFGKTDTVSPYRHIMLYKSSDNGLTWTKVANVSRPLLSNNYEEANVLKTNAGYWIATMRSDSNDRVDVSIGFSLNNWSIKGEGISTGFNSHGKASSAISPSGVIVITGRRASDNKAIWGWSNDGGKTFNENLITGVPNDYQTYGDVLWDSVNNRFLMVWSNDVSFPNGPAIIYGAFLTES